MMKITIVGGGNGGVFTALLYGHFARFVNSIEVELIYDPSCPPEPVGQATTLDIPELLSSSIGFDWYNNNIHATMKSGILYEGWGKRNDKIFHPFLSSFMAMHYCPWEVQKNILESKLFKVTEGNVDPKDVDADYVFDCRGKPTDFNDYNELKNPINSAILAKPNWDTSTSPWSRHVATPDGWTFVIPTHESSPSNDYCVGYCYNSNITSKEDSERNLSNMFDVEIKKHISFKNYVAKNPVIDNRIFLNGNRLFFLEPLESSSTSTYLWWASEVLNNLKNNSMSFHDLGNRCREFITQIQNFVLWHYHFGSKYDTPFWDYAKTLTFEDPLFEQFLDYAKNNDMYKVLGSRYRFSPINDMYDMSNQSYSQWPPFSFKTWYDGMMK